MQRKKVSSGSKFEKEIGYSRAVSDGKYVFVSGTTGYNYASMSIDEDVVLQAEQCFLNIEKSLLEVGSNLDQVIRVRYIFPDRDDFAPCWPVLQKYLGASRPAATMVVAQLLSDEMKVEIEVTARVWQARKRGDSLPR